MKQTHFHMHTYKQLCLTDAKKTMRRTRRSILNEPLQELQYEEKSKRKSKKKESYSAKNDSLQIIADNLYSLQKKEKCDDSEYETQNEQQSKEQAKLGKAKQAKPSRVVRKTRRVSTQNKIKASPTEGIKRRNRRPDFIITKTAIVSLAQMKNLGFNIRKLTSKELQEMCMAFCPENGQRTLGKSTIFSFQLEKMDRQAFRKLQCFVKMKLLEGNREYESMAADEDDDFVIDDI